MQILKTSQFLGVTSKNGIEPPTIRARRNYLDFSAIRLCRLRHPLLIAAIRLVSILHKYVFCSLYCAKNGYMTFIATLTNDQPRSYIKQFICYQTVYLLPERDILEEDRERLVLFKISSRTDTDGLGFSMPWNVKMKIWINRTCIFSTGKDLMPVIK